MPTSKIKELLEKYLNGTATPEEERVVENWYNALSGVEGSHSLTEDERERLKRYHWQRLRRELALSQGHQRRWPRILGMAAVFAGIMMIVYFATPLTDSLQRVAHSEGYDSLMSRHIIENNSDEVRAIALIDASTVSLYPGSVLTIDENFDESERRVTLVGRAIFDVSRNAAKPFYVVTNEVVTKVLGTNFLVDAYPEAREINISVNSGAVSVYSGTTRDVDVASQAAVILKPNQQAVYNKDDKRVSRTLVKNPRIVIPQEEVNRIRFEGAAVPEIFRALEKMYGVNIEFDEEAFSTCSMTTSISRGDLYQKIDVICDITGASYAIEDTLIRITGSGCH